MTRIRSCGRRAAAALLAFLLLATLFPASAFAAETEKQTVRVGYYPVTEYQDKDADGNYWGFGYDYYIQIQKYTGWEYEFVETSYADCMEQLAAGEIDIISGVIPTDARREQMLFSNYSISNTQSKLYARMSDNECFYEGYESFDGKTVAVMRGTLLTDLDDYQEKHHFTMTARAFDTLEQMEQALESGEVDLLYATSISETSATKIVARFHKISLYYGVSKAKPELLEELDGALQMIIDNNPNFYTQMSDKYMVSGANAFASFTEEEYAYTQSGTPVYVIMNPNWAPVSWYDEAAGAYRGIAADILDEISAYSGLQFVFCTDVEFRALMEKDPDAANDVLAILADDNTWAGRQNVMLSNRFVDASVVMVSKRGTHQTENAERIALPENFYISWKIAPTLPAEAITYYPTVEECLKAINAGRADVTYLNELVSTYYLSTLEFSDLYASTKSGYDENLAFALNADTDKPLMGVINKSLLAIGDAELSQIVMQDSAATERVTLAGLFYANPVTFLLVTVLIMLILGAAIIAAVLMRSKRRRLAAELEREQENAAARTEFFMMISHELRTPLNAIVGYLDMAAGLCAENGPEKEYLRRSKGAANQLTEVAEDMLDYTRIASSTAEIHTAPFDLKSVVHHVKETATLDAEKHGIRFQFKVSDIDHEFVIGDRLRVTQIMQNLLSNSVKFTPAGGAVEAELSETAREDGGLEIRFTARDTGKGMSPEFLGKVCAPFNQSDPSYSRTHGGLGLGLFLTKYYLDAMHGRLEVESELEKGSTFTVCIPLAKASGEQLVGEDVDYSHVWVLIGGADTQANQSLKDLLKRLKMKCDAVDSAKLVLRRAQSRLSAGYPYALCVLDENLLEEDGALISELGALEQAPKVFIMTDGEQRPATTGAVCRVLSKPIFQSALFDAVMSSFGGYEHEEKYRFPDYSGLHAMIVEDNAVNADILSNILKKMKLKTTICENGQAAVDVFAQNPAHTFDIFFMDIQMPVLNGYAATERIRACAASGGEAVPIVAVSANAFPEDIEMSMRAGMNEHLSKPVAVSRIGAVVEQYCRREK